MKKLLACLLIACTSLATLSSCSMDSVTGAFDTVKDKVTSVVDTVKDKVDELLGKKEEYNVEKAVDLVDSMYIDKVGAGRVDYEVSNSVMIGSTKYTVVWSVDVAEDVVKLVVGEESTKVVVSKVLTEDTDYKLTATVTAPDGTTGSVYFNGTVLAMPSIIPELISAKPVEGTAYKLYVWQDANKVDCYFNGVQSGFYFSTDAKIDESVNVYVKYVEGSDTKFNIYFEIDGKTQYIGVKEAWHQKYKYWTYNVALDDEPVSQFEYSEEYKTIVTTVPARSEENKENPDATEQNSTETLYLGANGTYNTISAYNVKEFGTKDDVYVGGLAEMIDTKSKTAEEKIAFEKNALNVSEAYVGDASVTLPLMGMRYANVAIAWTENSDNVSIDAEGVMTVTAPAAATTFTLTATFTCEGKTDTLEITVSLKPAPLTVTAPVEGVAYTMMMEQVNLNKTLYITNTAKATARYLNTSEYAVDACDVYAEKAGEAYKFYTEKDNTKLYLKVYLNSEGNTCITFAADGTNTFSYDAPLNCWFTTVEDTTYAIGTYKTYNTVSASKKSFYSETNTGVEQFPVQFMTKEKALETSPTKPETPPVTANDPNADKLVTNPVADKAYNLYFWQGNKETGYYVTGTMDGYYMATSTDVNSAVAFYLEATTGGYYLYYKNGDTKTYLNMVASGDYTNGKYEATASTVYTFNAEAKTLVANVNGKDFFFGTKGDATFTTIGPRLLSGIASDFFAYFIEATEGQGTVTPPAVELPEADTEITIAKAIEIAGKVTETTTSKWYVTGVVQAGINTVSGNLTIKDENGDSIIVYGSNYATLETKPIVGDTVTVYGVIGSHYGTPQIQSAAITNVVEGYNFATLPVAETPYYLAAFDLETYADSYITGVSSNNDYLTVGAKTAAKTVTFEAVADVENGYYIKLSTGAYVNAGTAKNKLSIGDTASTIWVIDINAMTIKQHDNDEGYVLQYNPGDYARISRYKGTSQAIWFEEATSQLTIRNYNPLGSFYDPDPTKCMTYNVTLNDGSAIDVKDPADIEGAKFLHYEDIDGNIVTLPETITEDVTVYAIWKVTPYTVTLVYPEGFDTTGLTTTITFGSIGDYNNGITPISDMNVWTLEGYLPEKGEYQYSIVEEVPETFELQNYTFNVKQEVATYQFTIVNYNPTGSMFDMENPSTYNVTLPYGSAITYTDPADQEGLTFLGYITYQLNFETWEEEEVAATIPETLTEDVTVYAKWEVAEFTVTVVYPDGYTADPELPNPITFGAISVWEDDIVAVGDLAWTLSKYLPAADENYVYVWSEALPETFELQNYTLTVEAKSAFTLTIAAWNPLATPKDPSGYNIIQVEVGATLSVEAPTATGFNFLGYTDVEGNTVTLPETLTEDLTVFANWEAIPYTVTINYPDGYTVTEYTVTSLVLGGVYQGNIQVTPADLAFALAGILPAETDNAVYSYAEEIPAEITLQDYTFTVVETAKHTLTIRNYNPLANSMLDPTSATLMVKLANGAAVSVELPTVAGCEFVEYQDVEGNVISLPETLTADFTAYAIWSYIPYTVTITYPEAYTAEKTESIVFAAKAEGEVMITNNDLPYVIADIVLADGYSFKSIPETFALENITLEVAHNCVLGTAEHAYNAGYCVCGAKDPDHYFVMTIPEVLAATVDEKVEVSGTVSSIYEAWSSHNNMSVYITDAEGNTLLVFRFATQVEVGNIITVKGVVGSYNDVNQIAKGATVTITGQDPNYAYTEMTIEEAIAAADGTNVILTGTIVSIDGKYTYIADENNTQILLYNASGTYSLGDVVSVKGSMATYSGNRQVAGGVVTVTVEHVCSTYSEATCKVPATCTVCGTAKDDVLLDHTYVEGVCSVCGAQEGVATVTASKSISDLITSEGWTNTTTKQEFKLDDNVTVKVDGGNNSGKAYDGNHIRIYATDSPAGSLTISVAEGYELVSVKVSTQTGTYAFLYVDDTTTDISNVETAVSGSSVLLNSVKNGSNGKQVRVTAIEVVYKAVQSAN